MTPQKKSMGMKSGERGGYLILPLRPILGHQDRSLRRRDDSGEVLHSAGNTILHPQTSLRCVAWQIPVEN